MAEMLELVVHEGAWGLAVGVAGALGRLLGQAASIEIFTSTGQPPFPAGSRGPFAEICVTPSVAPTLKTTVPFSEVPMTVSPGERVTFQLVMKPDVSTSRHCAPGFLNTSGKASGL